MGTAHVEGRTMAQAVSRQPVTVEAQVQPCVCLCTICGGHSGTQIGFFSKYFSFLVIIFLQMILTHSFIDV